jgi:Icc-related predicted phosphoesterase
MKILAVSDEPVSWIYSQQLLDRCGDVDLVVSCGDLPFGYLEFIASTLNRPCFYVRGNHDHKEISDHGPIKTAPEGWIDLDAHVTRAHLAPSRSLSIAGLEGCLRYRPHADAQYSQRGQFLRALTMTPHLMLRRPDVFISHAPPFGVHNGPDHAHTGFHAHNWVIARFKPRLFLHGHQHRTYDHRIPGDTLVNRTLVVNVHPYRILEL